MDKQNLRPQPAQPVHRITPGQLPPELAELAEEALQYGVEAFSASASVVLPASWCAYHESCSYDGDDAE